ncbi:MAG TPA: ATP synthase F1 subunit epsilon [bacterium]|nr:ATP synthase F1 subunit epsilon [bacterium]
MLNVRILTRTGEVYSGNATSVVLPGAQGTMEVLHRHVPFISVLNTGVITVKRDRITREFTLSSGIAFLVNDDLTVFSDASETAEQIDMARAMAAKKKAQEEMELYRGKEPLLYRMAQDHLRRADNRIKFVQRQKARRST